jgi:hypothetical protein
VAGKVGRRVNMIQKMCTHVCKWKNDTVETIQEWKRGDKEQWKV